MMHQSQWHEWGEAYTKETAKPVVGDGCFRCVRIDASRCEAFRFREHFENIWALHAAIRRELSP